MSKIKQDGFEFNIEQSSDFDARLYSPMKYGELPELKRGTIAYDDFWDEQDRRCLEGYAPEGMPRITGRHYFYLNFFHIKLLESGAKRKTFGLPFYRVLDHLLFLEIEKAIDVGYGIIIGKPRRVGLSYIGACNIAYELIFFKDNEVAVGAYKEDKALPLMDKVYKALQFMREEYKVGIRKTKDNIKIKYEINENKTVKEHGVGSSLDVKTFFSDPSAFEGGSYSFFIFEEIGLQENLIKSYKASEFCFMEGGIQFGMPFLFGTAGEVDKGSRDYEIMWKNPRSYNLKKIFIPAYMFYPVSDEDDESDNANFFDIKTGKTDEMAALKHIKERRVRALQSKDGYIKEIQSRPIEEKDLFLKTKGGLLDRIKINGQLRLIDSEEVAYVPVEGRLEWIDDDVTKRLLMRCTTLKEKTKVRLSRNTKIKFVEEDGGSVKKILEPMLGHTMMGNKADIAGTDSYDEEGLENVKNVSNGATIVYRTFSAMSKEYDLPVAYVAERGDGTSDDVFFENTLKLCVYYDCQTLVEYTKIFIINHFIDVGGEKYLKENPDLRSELLVKKSRNKYGFKVTTGSNGTKNLITKLLKLEVKDNIYKYWFQEILIDLINYGDTNTDLAMALGMVLIYKLDIFEEITDDLDMNSSDVSINDVLSGLEHYAVDGNGNVIIESYGMGDSGEDLQVFDSRVHLTGVDREKYINFVAEKQKKIAEERQKRLEKETYSPRKDPFEEAIEQEILKRQNNEL